MSERAVDSRATVALAATTTAGYGVLFYAYGVLLVPMEEDLGWSRSFLTGAFSAALLVAAVLTVGVGRWLDRHPPRQLLVGGAIAATVLVAAWGTVADRAAFVVVWVAIGACQAVLFYEPAFTILTKWLRGSERRRAVTAVTLLAGLASTIFGPLTAALERSLGWRGAVLALAGILGAVTIPSLALGLRRPATRGTPADPADPTDGSNGAGADRTHARLADDGDEAHLVAHTSPREVFASRTFWHLTTAYLLSTITTFAVAVYLVTYLRGRGMAGGAAASVLGAVGLVQVLGRGTFTRLAAHRSAITLGTSVLAAKGVAWRSFSSSPAGPGSSPS